MKKVLLAIYMIIMFFVFKFGMHETFFSLGGIATYLAFCFLLGPLMAIVALIGAIISIMPASVIVAFKFIGVYVVFGGGILLFLSLISGSSSSSYTYHRPSRDDYAAAEAEQKQQQADFDRYQAANEARYHEYQARQQQGTYDGYVHENQAKDAWNRANKR